MKYKILSIILVVFILSCKKESVKVSEIKNAETEKPSDTAATEEENEITDSGVLPTFPQTGKKAEDFVIKPYEIQFQAEGFLNDDQLKDIVIVLKNKNDPKDLRPALFLVKQKTGDYILKETSWNALSPEISYDDNKIYDYESVDIDKNKMLHVRLQGIGAVGTRETVYKYIDNKLVLVGVHTFNAGAGSQISVNYNLISGVADMELTDMIKDSMPSTHKIKNFKLKRQQLFVDDDPDSVLRNLPQADW
ncbi:hypothetical protein [Flavobacterium chilense]|uniref:Lipoprotein n=1 Tax=Flavobacterium chilense TaxID=946677 RepID=A0A1M7C8X0_9FLAO|nr:hypothetical protein [Flavobacterium chilense]SHL63576.1 hypothetical protein SAMN05444484_10263 [Flavobacterium chilense]